MFFKYYTLIFTIISIVYCQNVRVSHRTQSRPESLQTSDRVINSESGFNGDGSASFGEVEGVAGVDYPAYTKVPRTSFKCSDMPYNPGMYADLETNCQAYHVCFEGRKSSFLCGIGTVFSQEILGCDYWYSVDCADAPNYYNVNEELGNTNYQSVTQFQARVSQPLRSRTYVTNVQSGTSGNYEIPDYRTQELSVSGLDNYGSYSVNENESSQRQVLHSSRIKPVVRQTPQTQVRVRQQSRPQYVRPSIQRTTSKPLHTSIKQSYKNISPSAGKRLIRKQTPIITQIKEEIEEQNTPYRQQEYYDERESAEEIQDNRNIVPYRTVRRRPNYRQTVQTASYPRSYQRTVVTGTPTPQYSSVVRRPVLTQRQSTRSQSHTSLETVPSLAPQPKPIVRVRPQISSSQPIYSPIARQTIRKSRPVVTRYSSSNLPQISDDSVYETRNITTISSPNRSVQQITRVRPPLRSTTNVLRSNITTQLRPKIRQLSAQRQTAVELAEDLPTEQPNLIDDNNEYYFEEADYSAEEPLPEYVYEDNTQNRTRFRAQSGARVPVYSTRRVVQQRPNYRPSVQSRVVTRQNIRPQSFSSQRQAADAMQIETVRQSPQQIIRRIRPSVTRHSTVTSPQIISENTNTRVVSANSEHASRQANTSTQLIARQTPIIRANSQQTDGRILAEPQTVDTANGDNAKFANSDEFEYSDENLSDYVIDETGDDSANSGESRDTYDLTYEQPIRSTTRLIENPRRQQQRTYSRRVLTRPRSSSTSYSESTPQEVQQTIRKAEPSLTRRTSFVTSPQISRFSSDNGDRSVEISRPVSIGRQTGGQTVNEQRFVSDRQNIPSVVSDEITDGETIESYDEPIVQIRS